MSGHVAASGPHSTEWSVRLRVVEAGDLTQAHAVLDTGVNLIEVEAEAHRSRTDPADPEIGDELAVGRALTALGQQLIHHGSTAAEAADSARRRDPSPPDSAW
ncbi:MULTISPECIES: dsRBD fold-containing protein [unclassified Kitasatospora]|uniref:dsRBD fold-containing protein n=1 Tax=unclassified Kitasatospora TaxID=2633591 RepID=UPI00380B830F